MEEKKYITKDSGTRREYDTGSVRDKQEGKGFFYLIPAGPLQQLADLYERGARKYGPGNWSKGQPLMASFYDSAMRHLNQLKAGEPLENHAISVCWNMFAYIWTLEAIEAGRLPKELDDRPPPEPRYVPKAESKQDAPVAPRPTLYCHLPIGEHCEKRDGTICNELVDCKCQGSMEPLPIRSTITGPDPFEWTKDDFIRATDPKPGEGEFKPHQCNGSCSRGFDRHIKLRDS